MCCAIFEGRPGQVQGCTVKHSAGRALTTGSDFFSGDLNLFLVPWPFVPSSECINGTTDVQGGDE